MLLQRQLQCVRQLQLTWPAKPAPNSDSETISSRRGRIVGNWIGSYFYGVFVKTEDDEDDEDSDDSSYTGMWTRSENGELQPSGYGEFRSSKVGEYIGAFTRGKIGPFGHHHTIGKVETMVLENLTLSGRSHESIEEARLSF